MLIRVIFSDTHTFLRYDTSMEWSKKRKLSYLATFIGSLTLIILLTSYFAFRKNPTCFDAVQNGSEVGIDCGGTCALYCASEMKPLRIVWAKSFMFTPGHYDIGAYIENPNQKAGIVSLGYTVRAFGADEQKIAERKGVMGIAPGSSALLFEGNFSSMTLPVRTEVEFDSNYQAMWRKAEREEVKLVTKNYMVRYLEAGARFDAVVVNTDPIIDAGRAVIGAIILDGGRNPVAISRTAIDGIAKGSEQPIFFTWPEKFSGIPEVSQLIADIVIMQPAVFQK